MSTNFPTSLDSYTTKVDAVDDVLAAHVNDLQDAVVAVETALATDSWVDWTPTVTQTGSVALTITYAKYKIVNKICHVMANLVMTGSGTGGTVISVGGQPAAIQGFYAGSLVPIGTGIILDNGTAYYQGALVVPGAADWRMIAHGLGDYIGAAPSFALANTDIVSLVATYRVA